MEIIWIDSQGIHALKQGRFDDWANRFPGDWIRLPHIYEHLRAFCPTERFFDVTQWLLARGWNPRDPRQPVSPLIVAQVHKMGPQDGLRIMRLLMAHGVDMDDPYTQTPYDPNQIYDDWNPPAVAPLRHALFNNIEWAARFLIYEGARWPMHNGMLTTAFERDMHTVYRAMGSCRLAQRATVRALIKRDPRFRNVAIHLIAPAVWATRDREEWE